MPSFLLEPGIAIYAAMAVALVVWIGLFAFLWRLDRQARELRARLEERPRAEPSAPRATLESRSGPPRPSVVTNED